MSDLPERDGDGYLLNMNEWTPEIGRAMAEADGVELDDAKWSQIEAARQYYQSPSTAAYQSRPVACNCRLILKKPPKGGFFLSKQRF